MTGHADGVEGGFVVTARDIYDEVKAVRQIVEPLPARVTELEKGRDDHETRIRKLESWSARLAGARGLIALAVGCTGTAVVAHLWHP